MILAAAAGAALQRFAGVDGAVLPAVVIGMFVALSVPARAPCGGGPGSRRNGAGA